MRKRRNGLDHSFDTWLRNLVSDPIFKGAVREKEAEEDEGSTGLQDKISVC